MIWPLTSLSNLASPPGVLQAQLTDPLPNLYVNPTISHRGASGPACSSCLCSHFHRWTPPSPMLPSLAHILTLPPWLPQVGLPSPFLNYCSIYLHLGKTEKSLVRAWFESQLCHLLAECPGEKIKVSEPIHLTEFMRINGDNIRKMLGFVFLHLPSLV